MNRNERAVAIRVRDPNAFAERDEDVAVPREDNAITVPAQKRTEPLADTLMLLIDNNKVEAHAVADGKLLWPAELRLLGDLAVEPSHQDMPANMASPRTDALGDPLPPGESCMA